MTNGTDTGKTPSRHTHTHNWECIKTDKRTTHSTSLIQYLGFIAFLAARFRGKAANGSREDESYQGWNVLKWSWESQKPNRATSLEPKALHILKERRKSQIISWITSVNNIEMKAEFQHCSFGYSIRTVLLKQVSRWVSSVTITSGWHACWRLPRLLSAIKPMTSWLQGSLANHQAAGWRRGVKSLLICPDPAAWIIIGQLFEALDVHRKEMSGPKGGIELISLESLRKSCAKLKTQSYRDRATNLSLLDLSCRKSAVEHLLNNTQ